MQKGMGRLVLLIGTVVYILLGVLALMVYAFNVEFFSFVTLGILLQVVIALPMVAGLLGKPFFPLLDCAKFLLVMVVSLAMCGYLGVPQNSARYDPTSDGYKNSAAKIQAGDLGEKDRLELKVDLAEADDDDEKKEIRKKIEEVADGISKDDKKEAEQEMSVLQAKARLRNLLSDNRRSGIYAAERRGGLMLIAAFLMFAGAWLMKRDDE